MHVQTMQFCFYSYRAPLVGPLDCQSSAITFQFPFRVHSDMEEFKQKAKQCATEALHLFDSEVNQDNSSGTFLRQSMEYCYLYHN